MPLVKAQDPVCGMDVDPSETAFKTEHNGMSYFFCSQSCLDKFRKDPDAYLSRVPTGDTGPARGAMPSERSPKQENL